LFISGLFTRKHSCLLINPSKKSCSKSKTQPPSSGQVQLAALTSPVSLLSPVVTSGAS